MIGAAVLLSFWALIQCWSATNGLEENQVCTKIDTLCSNAIYPIPSEAEIVLLRESWNLAKQEKDIPTRIIVEHLRAHPKIAELLPGLEDVAAEDLPHNEHLLNRFRPRIHHALNFIINNLDTPELLAAALPRLNAEHKMYVDYVTPDQQNKETVRIIIQILEQEFGSRLTEETKSAWKKGLDYAFSLLLKDVVPSTSSALTDKDVALVRRSWPSIRDNVDILAAGLIKMFQLHPPTQRLYPELADVAIDQLRKNKDFLLHSSMAGNVLNLLIINLDDDRFVTNLLHKQTQAFQFVNYMDPIHQNDEIARIFLQVVQEHQVLDAETRSAWRNVLAHLSAVSAAALDTSVTRVSESVFSAAERSLIRDTWALAKSSSLLGPQILLMVFVDQPQMKTLYPKLANVPLDELENNRDFLAQAFAFQNAFTFLVENIDNSNLMADQVAKFASSSYFLPSPAIAQQMDNISSIVIEVMKTELGVDFTGESVAAFAHLLDFIKESLVENIGASGLSSSDRDVIGDILNIVKLSPDFGAKFLLKVIRSEPKTKNLIFPQLAKFSLSQLPTEPQFIELANTTLAGLQFVLSRCGDIRLLKALISRETSRSFFLTDTPVNIQLDAGGRMLMEALDEELGTRFSPRTRLIFRRAIENVKAAMLEIVV